MMGFVMEEYVNVVKANENPIKATNSAMLQKKM